MTAAYFEDHPTDPDKVIMRKPPHDVDLFWRAVTMPEKWVGLTAEEIAEFGTWYDNREEEVGWVNPSEIVAYIDAKLKEKNCG